MKNKNLIYGLLICAIWAGLFLPLINAQIVSNYGLQFEAKESANTSEPQTEKPPIKTESLSQTEAAEIFKRLPPMAVGADEDVEFNLRSNTVKPPKTGKIIPIKFPLNEQQQEDSPGVPKTTTENLRIDRYTPTGNASLVTNMTVKFSQPMVSVATQDMVSETVPIQITPEVKGKWYWLGTDSLTFDAETRFPMGTEFTATIAKGTKSAIGGVLQRDFSWRFKTPPPKVLIFAPKDEPQRWTPDFTIMAVKFNQAIDENEILQKIKVFADGKQWAIESASAEMHENTTVYRALNKPNPQHWLAFRTVETLPIEAEVKVLFEKGLPSAEGSAVSVKEQIFKFDTLPKFKLYQYFCDYKPNAKDCEPSNNFRIRFNRSFLNYPTKFDTSLIKVEPKIKDMSIEVNQGEILIKGTKTPNTIYKVTIPGKVQGRFKQKLGEDLILTFKVGIEHPQFIATNVDVVTLDPYAKPTFTIFSQNQPNFKVRLYSVTPEDYLKFRGLLRVYYAKNRRFVPTPDFGKLVLEKTFEINAKADELVENQIELSKFLPDKFGHLIIVAEPAIAKNKRYDRQNLPIFKWLQSTNIGIDAISDYEKLITYTSDLRTAKPFDNAKISFNYGTKNVSSSQVTEEGMAEFEFPDEFAWGFILAQNGFDSAILAENRHHGSSREIWKKRKPWDILRWFVFDDRKMYRPNEQVSIKGYVRKVTGGKFSDIAEVGKRAEKIYYILRDIRNNEVAKGAADLNVFGAFDFKLDLPENGNLGYHRLQFWTSQPYVNQPEFTHSFRVEEFRRPEFEVSVNAETPAPFYVGDKENISATAKYFTGGALSDSIINWNIAAYQTKYSPPNHDSFIFGTFVPWWKKQNSYEPLPKQVYFPLRTISNISGTTDANGKHQIDLDIQAANPARPHVVQATANVTDVNRQNIVGTKSFLVHPSDLYVGMRTQKTFVRQNEVLKVETIATDIDGNLVENAPIVIKAELKQRQELSSGNSQMKVVDTQTCNITSAKEIVSCEFKATMGGTFTITATVLDERERPNSSEITVWVPGDKTAPRRKIENEKIQLIPDKRVYSPGDTAEVLVYSPFFPAEGIMTLERNGIIKSSRFTLNENSTVLQIPIEEKYLPNIHVTVDLIGVVKRTNDDGEVNEKLPNRPALANGTINLEVSKDSRKLHIAVEPGDKTLNPGDKTGVEIEVKDNLGNPVQNSEVALVAVDEGVLALTNYQIKNPLDIFYQPIQSNVWRQQSREKVLLSDPDSLADSANAKKMTLNQRSSMSLPGYQVDGARADATELLNNDIENITSNGNQNESEISIRRNFNALAIFSPSVKTDTNGKATIKMKLPDNLTRYRITAVAVTKSNQFGLGESAITAKKSLQVRPSAPRFLNYGDNAKIPVVLLNQTDSPMKVNLAMRSNNAKLTADVGKKVMIPANERVEIRFPVSTEKSGYARFQIAAISGDLTDAAEIVIPVYTPASTEDFATYGTTDKNGLVVQQISTPKDVFADYGGLEVTTSSTQLQVLTDAFIYLQSYQFSCSEQIASRVLSVAAVRDVLSAFKAKEMPEKEKIEDQMKSDIARLQTLQHSDGGFSFWRNNDQSIPYVSVHVAHAIARAKSKGYEVPDQLVNKSLHYLRNIESTYPKEYSEKSRHAISAYALYVQDLFGNKVTTKAKKLLNEVGVTELSIESSGWLLSILANDKSSANEVAIITQHLLNRVTETAGNAYFATNYEDGEYVLLSSKKRVDAVILEALLRFRGQESVADSRKKISDSKSQISNEGRIHISDFKPQTSDREKVKNGESKFVKTNHKTNHKIKLRTEKTNPHSEFSNPQIESLIPKIVRGLLAHRIKGRWGSTQENAFVLLALDKYFQTYEKATPNFVAKMWLGKSFAGEQKYVGRSTDSSLVKVPMRYLQEKKKQQRLILDKQGDGRMYYRIGLKYAPKNLKIDSADYGFAVSRNYEAIDNKDDVKQNANGSWTIKSGSRVRINVQMVAPTRRYHVALVDNLPAGIEIVNSGLATTKKSYLTYSRELQGRSFWFNHQNWRDNRAEAFTTLLKEGVWNYSYLGTATTPGKFVVPPAKAEEMYSPETFGRSKTDIVMIE